MNIIGLSGKIMAGKTTIAKMLEHIGYNIINFSDPLKNTVCSVLDISREHLENTKDDSNVINVRDKLRSISDDTGIELKSLEILKRDFSSIRDLLQTLGTDVIRKHNPDFFIERTKDIIQTEGKWCIPDVRFHNELNMIKDLGGITWYVSRPSNFISSHISENTITENDFSDDNIIYNYGTSDDLYRETFIRIRKMQY